MFRSKTKVASVKTAKGGFNLVILRHIAGTERKYAIAWRMAPPAGELSVGVRILIKNPQKYLDIQNKLYYSHIVIKTLKFKILENQTKEKRKWKN